MSSSILDLQRDTLNQEIPVTQLLRRAYVIAKKLGLEEFLSWVEGELGGFELTAAVPDYRNVSGQVRLWNPLRGWIPLMFESAEEEKRFSRRKCGQALPELEALVAHHEPGGGLQMPLPREWQQHLSRAFPVETNVTLFVRFTSIVQILEDVRTALLNWTMQLEEDGILGDGLLFDDAEKHAAEKHQTYNVNHFYSGGGTVQVQQGTVGSSQVATSVDVDVVRLKALVADLTSQIDDIELGSEERDEVGAELATLEAQLTSPRPKQPILKEGLRSIRSVLEGAGGGAAGHLVIEIGKLLLGTG